MSVYVFRIRPFWRLFVALVLMFVADRFTHVAPLMPTDKAIMLYIVAFLMFVGSLIILLGVLRVLAAYLHTWR